MKAALPLLVIAAVSTAGCARIAQSALNPLTWFSASTPAAVTAEGGLRPLVPAGPRGVVDRRPLVASVTDLRIDRAAGGAIVVAEGVVPTQGYFNAELVRAGLSGGVLTLAFRAEPPPVPAGPGAEATRTITAALALDPQDLAGVSTIRVEAQSNARVAAR